MSPGMREAVKRVIAAMEEAADAGRPLDVDAMAEVARYSRFHLVRSFSAVTGQTPQAYLTGLRYEKAAQLLATTDLTLQGVCDRIGYRSVGTFVVRFRRRYGITPARYRRRARTEVAA